MNKTTTTTAKTMKELEKATFADLKGAFGYKNPMQAPRLLKVVVSTGIGSIKDKKKIELVADRLAKITGQKPALRGAKKSIASFKVRMGDPVGSCISLYLAPRTSAASTVPPLTLWAITLSVFVSILFFPRLPTKISRTFSVWP